MDFVTKLFEEVRRIVLENVAQNAPSLLYGKVLGVEPLKIRVKDTYEIDEDFIVLDSRCRETWINIPTDGNYEHVHDEDERLVDMQGITAAGPVTFAPADVPVIDMTVTDPETGEVHTEYQVEGGGTVLSLKHKHSIHKALPKICLWRGLMTGDKVKILRIGAVHLILERLEGITNDTDSEQ